MSAGLIGERRNLIFTDLGGGGVREGYVRTLNTLTGFPISEYTIARSRQRSVDEKSRMPVWRDNKAWSCMTSEWSTSINVQRSTLSPQRSALNVDRTTTIWSSFSHALLGSFWGENGQQYAQRAKGALNLLPLSRQASSQTPTDPKTLSSQCHLTTRWSTPPKTTKPVS